MYNDFARGINVLLTDGSPALAESVKRPHGGSLRSEREKTWFSWGVNTESSKE